MFCPECFAPIDNELPESFLDDRSERPQNDESDEEGLLDDRDDEERKRVTNDSRQYHSAYPEY